jgi:hypothetical protein
MGGLTLNLPAMSWHVCTWVLAMQLIARRSVMSPPDIVNILSPELLLGLVRSCLVR